jgi:hypothetical protein
MNDNREQIRPYVADMAAVEKHILEALERQQKDETMKAFPEARGLVDRLALVLKTHVDSLENHASDLPGGSVATTVKETLAGALGAVAGVYDKVRKEVVSRNLRDDYTALSLAAISYTMLHATALGLRQTMTAEIALRHLEDLTPFVMELAEIIPGVVLKELSLEGYDIDTGCAAQAVRETQQAWRVEASTGANR